MKKPTTSILKLCMLSLIISSCTNDSPTPKGVYSKWNWISSTGGRFVGENFTPTSVGYTRQIEFDKDGTYKEYKNDSLLASTMFTLSVTSSLINAQTPNLIIYSSGRTAQSYQIKSNDTLYLFDQCIDCYLSGFVRIK